MLALIGVVIGAVATGGVTLGIGFVQARRARNVAQRLAAADVADALRAIQGVQASLLAGRDWPVGGDEWHEEDRKWPPGWERANWTQSWQSYRETLASAIREAQFADVARAFGIMTQLQSSLAAGERPFVASDKTFVNDVAERLSAASRALPLTEKMISDPLLPTATPKSWPGVGED